MPRGYRPKGYEVTLHLTGHRAYVIQKMLESGLWGPGGLDDVVDRVVNEHLIARMKEYETLLGLSESEAISRGYLPPRNGKNVKGPDYHRPHANPVQAEAKRVPIKPRPREKR